jgi:hypothetical protein
MIFSIAMFLIAFGLVSGCLDVDAQEKQQRKELEENRNWQLKKSRDNDGE